MSGYFDCVCCGTTDIGEDSETLCEACVLCDCTDEAPACRELLVDGSHGIYVAQVFVKNFAPAQWSISESDAAILSAGPDNENYWETWGDIEGYVEGTFDGKRWVLEQDGDLWARCVGKAG